MIAPRAVSLSRSPQHAVAEAKCGLTASRLSPENRVSYVPTTTPDNRKVSTCHPAQRQHAASVPTPACPRADAARGAQTGPSPRRPTRRVSAASGSILWQAAPQRLLTFLEYGGAPPMRSGDMRRAHASPAASSPLRPVLPVTGRALGAQAGAEPIARRLRAGFLTWEPQVRAACACHRDAAPQTLTPRESQPRPRSAPGARLSQAERRKARGFRAQAGPPGLGPPSPATEALARGSCRRNARFAVRLLSVWCPLLDHFSASISPPANPSSPVPNVREACPLTVQVQSVFHLQFVFLNLLMLHSHLILSFTSRSALNTAILCSAAPRAAA